MLPSPTFFLGIWLHLPPPSRGRAYLQSWRSAPSVPATPSTNPIGVQNGTYPGTKAFHSTNSTGEDRVLFPDLWLWHFALPFFLLTGLPTVFCLLLPSTTFYPMCSPTYTSHLQGPQNPVLKSPRHPKPFPEVSVSLPWASVPTYNQLMHTFLCLQPQEPVEALDGSGQLLKEPLFPDGSKSGPAR